MRKLLLTLIIALSISNLFSQSDKVKGNISTIDTADLNILNIYPDSFPNVSVVFKAETRKGEPVWNLTKEKMKVQENKQNCEVISLEQISKNKPINLGIVIDHSGSMEEDPALLIDKNGNFLFSFDENGKATYPKGYKQPLENAKAAVKDFVKSFNNQKDFISIIGFSSIVDKKLALSQNVTEINATIDSMKADNMTALYDAMITALDEIKNANGIKVLVVLTDGQDNVSKAKWKDVIKKANKEEIPIYIIGLGDVSRDILENICVATKGHFYFTTSSSSLSNIYADISKKVQAFYNLVYHSVNFSSADTSRQIEVSFDSDSLFLVTNKSQENFPKEVVAIIEKKEKQKDYLLYGGIATVILISAGTLQFKFRRKSIPKPKAPSITKLYPNPTNGFINIEYSGEAGKLLIHNMNGQLVQTIDINSTNLHLDISHLQNGNYIATIQTANQISNPMKITLLK